MIIDTHKDEALLLSYFQHCLNEVSSDSFLVGYAQEKKVHSLQVVGAGNYIMKHESIFQSEDEDIFLAGALRRSLEQEYDDMRTCGATTRQVLSKQAQLSRVRAIE